MGSALGCIMCDDSDTARAKLTSSLAQTVRNSCGTNLSASEVESNLTLNMTGVDCGTISFGNQQVELDVNCTVQTALHAATQSLASLVAGAQNSGGLLADLNVMGAQIDRTSTNVSQAISEAIYNTCLHGDNTAQTTSNATVNMSGCSCSDATFFTQTTNWQLTCILSNYQSAVSQIQAQLTSGTQVSNPFGAFFGSAIGLVLLAFLIIGGIIVLVVIVKAVRGKAAAAGINSTGDLIDAVGAAAQSSGLLNAYGSMTGALA